MNDTVAVAAIAAASTMIAWVPWLGSKLRLWKD